MTVEKLKSLEPLFDKWYVDSMIAHGRNSKVFKVFNVSESQTFQCVSKPLNSPQAMMSSVK